MNSSIFYQLMYKDKVVIEFRTDNPNDNEIVNKELLPVGIQNGMSLKNWLRQRRADRSRVSVRKIFATLKMNFGDDKYVSQFRRPTDFWWVKKKDGNEGFDAPVEDLYRISLNLSTVIPKSPRNFEVANIGSYEKGWKGDKLLKVGNINEIFSELLYSKVSEKYMETAEYLVEEIDDRRFIASSNFVTLEKGEYLVLADEWTGTGPEEEFEGWFEMFKNMLRPEEICSLKEMYFFDVVFNNFDRHCQNFGFVYNEDGSRRVAPNFDFNLSIIGYNGLENLGENEIPVKSYFKLFDRVADKFKDIPDLRWLKEEITLICQLLDLVEEYLVVADWIVKRWERLI